MESQTQTTTQTKGEPIPQNVKHIDIEFGKHITSIEFIKYQFRMNLAGWKEIVKSKEITTPFGTETEVLKSYIVEEDRKLCNDTCSDLVYSSMVGLISQLTTTAKLNADKIFDDWNLAFFNLLFRLQRNYFLHNNTYEIIDSLSISAITSYFLSYNEISYKALDGFTLIEIMDSILEQRLIKNDQYADRPQKAGFLGSIFGGKKKE